MLSGNKKKAGQAPSISVLEESSRSGSKWQLYIREPISVTFGASVENPACQALFLGYALGKMASTLVPSLPAHYPVSL